jgi:GDPmannose 4,6-dehydratase
VEFLLSDPAKVRDKLNWEPRVAFRELVRIMVDADMELLGLESPGEGKKILQRKDIKWTQNKVTVG